MKIFINITNDEDTDVLGKEYHIDDDGHLNTNLLNNLIEEARPKLYNCTECKDTGSIEITNGDCEPIGERMCECAERDCAGTLTADMVL